MEKITEFNGINTYYCSKHNKFHIKKFKYKIDKNNNRIKTKDTPFYNCQEFAMKLTDTELYNKQFNRSCKLYSIKKHKEAFGSKKQ